ncbi:hypothetical protein BY996DRAFT_6418717 [Phakopsora pachyrhizi]|nr:hypothetical protein BY996DRAFT_6418717 [Phakopsora pachyrhizi]
MTTPGDEEARRPTNKNKKVGLNEGQFQRRVVTRRVICGQQSILESEAQTDRLYYDLREWKPVEYEYLGTFQSTGQRPVYVRNPSWAGSRVWALNLSPSSCLAAVFFPVLNFVPVARMY